MTIIKITSNNLLYSCEGTYCDEFTTPSFCLFVGDDRYVLGFIHLCDNLYGLNKVLDYEADIVYDDEGECGIKDILLLSPFGYGNILPLKVTSDHEGGISVFCDDIIHLADAETAYFHSGEDKVFMVTNTKNKYSVYQIYPYIDEVEVTQEIKDNIKLI